jgi:protein MpaA
VGTPKRIRSLPAVVLALVAVGAVALAASTAPRPASNGGGSGHPTRVDQVVQRRVMLGRSIRGRPITALEQGDPDTPSKVLIVGSIHGNETAGVTIARRLGRQAPQPESDRWVIDDLNPDGVASGTRQNARGVDLNRNFPYGWRQLGRRGDQQFSGPGPLSEPESRIAHALILRLRPRATVWFHQPLGVVDESGGSIALERRFAMLVGLPTRRLTRYPGSAAGWQNHRLPDTTAFVVELQPGPVSRQQLARYAGAVLDLSRKAPARLPN